MGTEGNYKDRIIGQNEIIIDNEAKDNEGCLEVVSCLEEVGILEKARPRLKELLAYQIDKMHSTNRGIVYSLKTLLQLTPVTKQATHIVHP